MAEQNSYDFWTRYSNLCLKCKVCPLQSVIKQMKSTTLSVKIERIRCEHWQFLLSALSVDNSLTEICFISDLPSLDEQVELWKKRKRKGQAYPIPYGYSPQNISDICKYTNRLLNVSQTLKVLILDHLPITKDDAGYLSEGLKNNNILQQFGLTCYPYGDEIIEIICRGVWSSRITTLEFNACDLSCDSVQKICDVIKKHRDRGMTEAFPDTLRHRSPDYKEQIGLNRLSLNGNNIGNQGARLLFEALTGDYFVKVLELQCCGMDDVGGLFFYKLTESSGLAYVDLRQNKMSPNLLSSIQQKLKINNRGNIPQPTLLWRPQHLSELMSSRKPKAKLKVLKKYPKVRPVKKERSRLSIHITNEGDVNLTKSENAAVQTDPYNEDSEIKRLQGRLRKVEERLSSEISVRNNLIALAKRIKDENANLREEVSRLSTYDDVIFIDQETYSEIKRVFEKFQKFLRLMKEYGLWELISTVGVAEYENTKLKAIPSDTKVDTLEADNAPLDARLYKIPKKQKSIPRQQTQCCGCPECTSNASKNENCTIDEKPPTESQDQTRIKNIVDKSKVTKVFKEIRDHYINGEFPRSHPLLAHKFPAGNLRSNVPDSFQCRGLCQAELAQNFRSAKTKTGLFQKIAEAMERSECFCPLILQNMEEFPASKRKTSTKDVPSSFKNVSSQTTHTDMPINYSCHKVNLPTLSGKGSPITVPKSQPNSSSSCCNKMNTLAPDVLQKAVNLVSREWTEHVKKNFPDSNEDSIEKTVIDSFSSIVSNVEYFKTKVSSEKPSLEQSMVPSKVNDYKSEAKYSSSSDAASIAKSQTKLSHSLINELSEMIMDSNSKKSIVSSPKKSYLETVSDASTDKDVTSLSEIEIFDPDIKGNSASSKNSIISTIKPQKNNASSNTNSSSDTINSKPSSKSKSGKKNQKQAKKSLHQTNTGGRVTKNKNASSSSVPSLSDITTVSSNSMNTDSVMGQISGS